MRTFAVSAYGQLSEHHGLRFNVATFPNPHLWAATALAGDGGASGGTVIPVLRGQVPEIIEVLAQNIDAPWR